VAESVNLPALFSVLLADFNDSRCVFGKCQGITAFGNQGFRGFPGLVRSVPGINPFDMNFSFRIGGFYPQREGIDMTNQLRNRKGGYITDLIGLRQRSGHHAVEIISLIQIGEIGADIGQLLEPRAVHEFFVRVLLSGFEGVFHIAEAGGKNDINFFILNEAVDNTGGICFGH